MSKIEFLREQIIEARNFVNRLISEMPEELWYTIPEGTDSNFAWQIGHLLVSQNFHAITTITGVNEDIKRQIPIAVIIKSLMVWGLCTVPLKGTLSLFRN